MKIAVLILAAGDASRFSSAKQLAVINGKPMLQHCIDTANTLFAGAVYTVLGSRANDVRQHISGTEIILNPEWQRGLGRSIAVGASHLKNTADAMLVLLADQPRINSQYLERLVALFKGQQVACSQYHHHLGVPAIFAERYFDVLIKLDGDKGAKELLQSLCPAPKSLTLGDIADDIDYPADLATLIQSLDADRT
jgi:molybdenum cofactor cytidylyltransferase